MKLVIDTDPGIDDAMAIAFAMASERLDLVALTTVFGNVEVAQATNNALWLSEHFGFEIPVYEGAAEPLGMQPLPVSTHVHGEFGFGAHNVSPKRAHAEKASAAEYLVHAAASDPGALTVCAIGPLTNIAQAIALDADFLKNLKQLMVMGGSLRAGGNVTPYAEANFWHDPHAADQVVTADGASNVAIMGLDVTTKIPFFPHDLQTLAAASPGMGKFLCEIGQFYMSFYETVTGTRQAYVHDAAAVLAVERPELFGFENHKLSVICDGDRLGQMHSVSAQPGGSVVFTSVDTSAVTRRLLDGLRRLP